MWRAQSIFNRLGEQTIRVSPAGVRLSKFVAFNFANDNRRLSHWDIHHELMAEGEWKMLLTMARNDIMLESAPYEAGYVLCTMFTLGKCGRLQCSAAEVLYVFCKDRQNVSGEG